MSYATFAEYQAAKMEVIGGVEYTEDTQSPNQWGMNSKQYATAENGTFYETTGPKTGITEFWSDKHPDSRYYREGRVSDPPTDISDELLDDIAVFTETYVIEVRAAVIKNINAIAVDSTLVKLLREYATRKREETDTYRREIRNIVRYGDDYRPSNNCLTHSESYRDVIYDLLKPYWKGEND